MIMKNVDGFIILTTSFLVIMISLYFIFIIKYHASAFLLSILMGLLALYFVINNDDINDDDVNDDDIIKHLVCRNT